MSMEHTAYPFLEERKSQIEQRNLDEKYWCKLAERLFNEQGELGYGQTATVYDSTQESGLCIKRMKSDAFQKFPFMNDLNTEADFLKRVNDIIAEGDDVIVPSPAMFISSQKIETVTQKNLRGEMVTFDKKVREQVLVMEKINGTSLEDVFDPKEQRFKKELPENFDKELFFLRLEKFVHKMNDAGIYHRDLHFGNIMIDYDTKKPVIIDFGFSRRRFFSEEDVYFEDSDPRETKSLVSDIDNLETIKKYLQ